MLLLLLSSCVEVKKDTSTEVEDTGYVFHDTSAVVDSGRDSGEDTGDSGPIDTGDSAPVDTGDTAPVDTAAPTLLELSVYPASMVVHPGATWSLRLVATDLDGVRGDATGATFGVDDAAVVAVDADGNVTALAAGVTTVRVSLGGLEATETIEVRADGVVTVTVVDASTGLPVEGARVSFPTSGSVPTDASGVALLEVADGGPVTVSAWGQSESYDAVSLVGTVSRAITLPVWPKDVDPDDASIYGAVDFSGVDDGGWTDLVVGFAASSIQGELGATVLDDLFSDTRALSVYGVEGEAPANVFVEGYAEDYYVDAQAGAVGVWGLAGPMPIGDVSGGLTGTGDALALLVAHLDSMTWGATLGGTAVLDAQNTLDLAPTSRFDDVLPLTLPALPAAGFNGGEELFVLVTEERADEGFVGTGLGIGAGTVDVATVPAGSIVDSLGTAVLAVAQVGGVGSGGATSSAVGREDTTGAVAFPELLDLVSVDAWDPATRALSFTADVDAHLVRVRVTDTRNRVHDVYFAGSWSGELPRCNNDFGWGQATGQAQALQTTEGVFEDWVPSGTLAPDALPVTAAARTTW